MSGQSGAAPGSNFLPNFCSLRSAFVVVVSAELLAVVLAFAGDAPLAEFWPALALRSLYVQWVAVLATVLLCALRRPLTLCSHSAAGLVAWAVITLTAAVVALVAVRLVPQTEPFDPATFVLRSVAVAAIVAALLLRYLYHQHQQQDRELAASRARFEALQARIRPHFLFNSMNTIASLIRGNPAAAEQAVEDLADLFRASLSEARQRITLTEELEIARVYERMEQQRLGERRYRQPHLPGGDHAAGGEGAIMPARNSPGLTIKMAFDGSKIGLKRTIHTLPYRVNPGDMIWRLQNGYTDLLFACVAGWL